MIAHGISWQVDDEIVTHHPGCACLGCCHARSQLGLPECKNEVIEAAYAVRAVDSNSNRAHRDACARLIAAVNRHEEVKREHSAMLGLA